MLATAMYTTRRRHYCACSSRNCLWVLQKSCFTQSPKMTLWSQISNRFTSFKSPQIIFLIRAFLGYSVLFITYQFIVIPYTSFDQWVIRALVKSSEALLKPFGPTFSAHENSEMQVIGIDGSTGVWIGTPCNGIHLIGLFSVFIMAYPGSWRRKLYYIPFGILLLFGYNSIRICALAWLSKFHPQWLLFNHNYTFTASAYILVFVLWMVWVKRLSKT